MRNNNLNLCTKLFHSAIHKLDIIEKFITRCFPILLNESRSKVESDTMSYYQLRPFTVLAVHNHFMRLMDILTRSNYRFSNMVLMWSPKVCLVLRTFAPYDAHTFVIHISPSPFCLLVRTTLTLWVTSFSLSSFGYA